MKRLLSMLLLVSLLCCPCALADQLTDDLNARVPFGVAHSADGKALAVYNTVSARSSADRLTDYQLCAILSTKESGGAIWYQIRYISGKSFKEGYIKGDAFYPLTLAGLILAAVCILRGKAWGCYVFALAVLALFVLNLLVVHRDNGLPDRLLTVMPMQLQDLAPLMGARADFFHVGGASVCCLILTALLVLHARFDLPDLFSRLTLRPATAPAGSPAAPSELPAEQPKEPAIPVEQPEETTETPAAPAEPEETNEPSVPEETPEEENPEIE